MAFDSQAKSSRPSTRAGSGIPQALETIDRAEGALASAGQVLCWWHFAQVRIPLATRSDTVFTPPHSFVMRTSTRSARVIV